MLLQTASVLSWDDALRLQSWAFWLLPCAGVVMLYLFWERFWLLYSATNLPTKLLENIKPLIRRGDKATPIQLCQNHKTPSAKLLIVGINKLGKSFKEIHDSLHQEMDVLLHEYERKWGYLILFSEILPVLGLCIVLVQTQFFTVPFLFVHLVPFWVGWLLGFLGSVGYNVLVMRLRATKRAMDATIHAWLGFLQES